MGQAGPAGSDKGKPGRELPWADHPLLPPQETILDLARSPAMRLLSRNGFTGVQRKPSLRTSLAAKVFQGAVSVGVGFPILPHENREEFFDGEVTLCVRDRMPRDRLPFLLLSGFRPPRPWAGAASPVGAYAVVPALSLRREAFRDRGELPCPLHTDGPMSLPSLGRSSPAQWPTRRCGGLEAPHAVSG